MKRKISRGKTWIGQKNDHTCYLTYCLKLITISTDFYVLNMNNIFSFKECIASFNHFQLNVQFVMTCEFKSNKKS